MNSRIHQRYWRRAIGVAVLLYCFWACALILRKPGLQYDEALMVLGSVQMRNSPLELPLPHHSYSWIHVFHRWIPLMTLPYVGAIKEYLCLPVVALFGPRTTLIRLVSMLLGAIGIWGMARLIREQESESAAAIFALILAINPAYINMTIFDNSAVGIWMAALGFFSVALLRYLRKPAVGAAFLVGVSMGFAVWARANFLWLLAAALVAMAIVLRRRLLGAWSHWAAAIGGSVVGGSPFLLYEVHSKGFTWHQMGMLVANESLRQRLLNRMTMLSWTFLYDREHSFMWGGPELPEWQSRLVLGVAIAACLTCLVAGGRWARIIALSELFLAAIMMPSPMAVSEHHLIAILPFAALTVVLAASILQARYKAMKFVMAALAVGYAGCALYWNAAAIEGLQATGGNGAWSDAMVPLAVRLETEYQGREVKVLDWGLANNLFVLTGGGLKWTELFWDATTRHSGLQRPWSEEIREGGIFLLNGRGHRAFPAATEGFLEALAETTPTIRRRFTIPQRDGTPYAEFIEIEPNTAHAAIRSRISTGDPRAVIQLEGFYKIEESGWRWTKRKFAVTLNSPGAKASTLTLNLYIPDLILRKLGPITLSAEFHDHVLKPETFRQSGACTFTRDLAAGWVEPGANRFEFALDKSQPPTASEPRELGIVVSSASLDVSSGGTGNPR